MIDGCKIIKCKLMKIIYNLVLSLENDQFAQAIFLLNIVSHVYFDAHNLNLFSSIKNN